MGNIEDYRQFMKSMFGKVGISDQSRGVSPPPIEAPYDHEAEVVLLPEVSRDVIVRPDLFDCISRRRSRRDWTADPLTIDLVSFLLWATQGVSEVLAGGRATLRTVPSGGARHPFETYVVANSVAGLDPRVYRYLPLTHRLLPLFEMNDQRREDLTLALLGQRFAAHAPVLFVWSCIPYRGEWRYTLAAHKTMLQDAGHMCQNLYLACEAIGAGMCAIGAYDQESLDAFLNLDGNDEFAVYGAPVGHPKER
ncbi:MAG: SagB/ThcOx family dehydrogenase [Candidatus Hydrogenedentes bacterium]|nr:SagB/ThcOx family dehydrogenase [Candidatus Hydrogenedentota bacterium]